MSGLQTRAVALYVAACVLIASLAAMPLTAPAAGGPHDAVGVLASQDPALADDGSEWMAAFDESPRAGLRAWWQRVRIQSREAPLVLTALSLQARGERVEPPFAESRVAALYVLGGVAIAGLILLLRGRPGVAIAWLGLVGGLVLGAATGLWVLTSAAVLAGVVLPAMLPLLRVLLRRADHTERAPPAPVQLRRTSGGVRPAVVAPPPRPATAHSSSRPTPQQIDAFAHLVMDVARAQLQRLRPKHVLLGIVLLVIEPLFLLLALVAVALVAGYRHGIAYAAADLLLRDDAVRARVLDRLPRPASRQGDARS